MSEALIQNLDLWTTSIRQKSTSGRGSNSKIELAGIKKLRELILELAVRGKLVPQDPSDEPASELLKRIAAEIVQLVNEGKLKKQKPLPSVSDEEKPFKLPQGWEWKRLAEIVDIQSGIAKGKKFQGQKTTILPYLRVANVQRGHLILEEIKSIEILESDLNKYQVLPRDLLITEGGGWYKVGRTAIWPAFDGVMLHQNHVFKARLLLDQQSEYWIEKYLNCPLAREYFAGASKQTTNLASINKTQLSNCVIPVPPLAEQHRIVAKVDELMALCDQLENQSEQQLAAHQQLVETLLDSLLKPAAGALTLSQNAQELAANWQRLADHFDLLFSGALGGAGAADWAIDKLKDTILQLAVQGKLVPQNPNDEPASELLKRIAAEKAQLVKEGKIKKQKLLPPVSDEEKPFELPESWEWVKLAQITDIQSGIAKGKKYNNQKTLELPYLRVANVQRGFLILDEIKTIEILESDQEKYKVLAGDLLITEGGDWDKVGRTAIWPKIPGIMLHQNHVFKARPYIVDQNENWLEKYLNGPFARDYFAGSSKQTTNLASINKTQLSNCVLPIPPEAEQQRIIQKIDELFTMCDQLKSKLKAASETQLNLTDALVEQALQ